MITGGSFSKKLTIKNFSIAPQRHISFSKYMGKRGLFNLAIKLAVFNYKIQLFTVIKYSK
jgi:hypothetical protein